MVSLAVHDEARPESRRTQTKEEAHTIPQVSPSQSLRSWRLNHRRIDIRRIETIKISDYNGRANRSPSRGWRARYFWAYRLRRKLVINNRIVVFLGDIRVTNSSRKSGRITRLITLPKVGQVETTGQNEKESMDSHGNWNHLWQDLFPWSRGPSFTCVLQ